jgi:hypothetical protein
MINALMMEAVRTSETSVNFNVATRRYIPEDSKLQSFLQIYHRFLVTMFYVVIDITIVIVDF